MADPDRLKEKIRYYLKKRGYHQGDLANELHIVPSALSHKLSGRNPWMQHELELTSKFLELDESEKHALFVLAGLDSSNLAFNDLDLEQVLAQVFERAELDLWHYAPSYLGEDPWDIAGVLDGTASYGVQGRIAEKILTHLEAYLEPEQIEWLRYYKNWCAYWKRQLPDGFWADRRLLHKLEQIPDVEKLDGGSDTSGMSLLSQLLDKEYGDQFLRHRLPDILNQYQDSQTSVAIALVDIDELTIINKQYGNEVGDKVLATVGQILHAATKSHEYHGRCGDDTFYAIFPGFSIKVATSYTDRILEGISRFRWSSIATNLRVTCSAGVAQWSGKEDGQDVVVRASIGMVKAKEEGRNRTIKGPEHLAKNLSRELRNYYS